MTWGDWKHRLLRLAEPLDAIWNLGGKVWALLCIASGSVAAVFASGWDWAAAQGWGFVALVGALSAAGFMYLVLRVAILVQRFRAGLMTRSVADSALLSRFSIDSGSVEGGSSPLLAPFVPVAAIEGELMQLGDRLTNLEQSVHRGSETATSALRDIAWHTTAIQVHAANVSAIASLINQAPEPLGEAESDDNARDRYVKQVDRYIERVKQETGRQQISGIEALDQVVQEAAYDGERDFDRSYRETQLNRDMFNSMRGCQIARCKAQSILAFLGGNLKNEETARDEHIQSLRRIYDNLEGRNQTGSA